MVGVVPVLERGRTECFSDAGSTDLPKKPWEVEIAAPGREVLHANAELADDRARSARRVNTFMVCLIEMAEIRRIVTTVCLTDLCSREVWLRQSQGGTIASTVGGKVSDVHHGGRLTIFREKPRHAHDVNDVVSFQADLITELSVFLLIGGES
jgi:hypothetical protein